jgi:hypothetical protein
VNDALNRRACEMHVVTTISIYCSYLKSRILEVVALDKHYAQITKGLQQENISLKFKCYKLEEDGILLFRDRVYVPNTQELRNIVLKVIHIVPYVGHLGYHKKIEVVRSQYF